MMTALRPTTLTLLLFCLIPYAFAAQNGEPKNKSKEQAMAQAENKEQEELAEQQDKKKVYPVKIKATEAFRQIGAIKLPEQKVRYLQVDFESTAEGWETDLADKIKSNCTLVHKVEQLQPAAQGGGPVQLQYLAESTAFLPLAPNKSCESFLLQANSQGLNAASCILKVCAAAGSYTIKVQLKNRQQRYCSSPSQKTLSFWEGVMNVQDFA